MKMLKNNKLELYAPYFIGGAFLILCCFWNIVQANFPVVLNDEFGYLGNAAILAGYPWNELMAETPYYSVGYSILLVPLFIIFNDCFIIYRTAIIINIVLIICSYLLIIYIINTTIECPSYQCALFAVAAVVSSNALFYSQLAWSEIFLFFLMWLSVALVTKILCNRRLRDYFLLWGCLLVMFIVHQRAICVIIGGIIWIIYEISRHSKLSKCSKWVFVLAVAFLAVSIFLIQRYIMNIQIERIYSSSETVSGNAEVLSQALSLDILFALFFREGLLVIKSLLGIIAAIWFSSLGLAFLPLIHIRDCFGRKKSGDSNRCELVMFILSVFIISLILSAIQTRYSYRQDVIVYTRYIDYCVGPMVLLGLLLLSGDRRRTRFYYSVCAIAFPCVLYIVGDEMKRATVQSFNPACSPSIGAMFQYIKMVLGNVNEGYSVLIVTHIGIMAGLILVWFIVSIDKKVFCNITTCLVITFSIICFRYSNQWIMESRAAYREFAEQFGTYLCDEYASNNSKSILYMKHNDQRDLYCTDVKYIQYRVLNIPIEIVKSNGNEDEYLDNVTCVISDPNYPVLGKTPVITTSVLSLYESR